MPAEHLRRAQRTFPLFAADYRAELRFHRLDQDFRALYNGRVVGEITGLEGKTLGRALAVIAAAAGGKDALRDRVLRLTRTLEGEAAREQVASMVRQALDKTMASAE